jgi:hypothetical protein
VVEKVREPEEVSQSPLMKNGIGACAKNSFVLRCTSTILIIDQTI